MDHRGDHRCVPPKSYSKGHNRSGGKGGCGEHTAEESGPEGCQRMRIWYRPSICVSDWIDAVGSGSLCILPPKRSSEHKARTCRLFHWPGEICRRRPIISGSTGALGVSRRARRSSSTIQQSQSRSIWTTPLSLRSIPPRHAVQTRPIDAQTLGIQRHPA